VHSTSSAPEILTISGINSDGKNVMQIINLKNDNVKVDIEGISGNLSKSVSTTEKENWKENGINVTSKNGKVKVELQPQSLNTLVF
jgi:O-glycosyl hydrolase